MFSRALDRRRVRPPRSSSFTGCGQLLPLVRVSSCVLVLGCGEAKSELPTVRGSDEPSGAQPSNATADSGAAIPEGNDHSEPLSAADAAATSSDASQDGGAVGQAETGAPAVVSEQPEERDAAAPVLSELDASPEQDTPAPSPPTPTREGGPCPEAPPELGATCEPWGTSCTYDRANEEASSTQCLEAYNCHATGVWTTANVSGVELCFGPPPAQCAEPVVAGQSCNEGAPACSSGEATCECTTGPLCSPDGHCADPAAPRNYAWSCAAQQVDCPRVPDNAGTRCEDATSRCLYGDPCGGIYVVCVEGYTEWESALCP